MMIVSVLIGVVLFLVVVIVIGAGMFRAELNAIRNQLGSLQVDAKWRAQRGRSVSELSDSRTRSVLRVYFTDGSVRDMQLSHGEAARLISRGCSVSQLTEAPQESTPTRRSGNTTLKGPYRLFN